MCAPVRMCVRLGVCVLHAHPNYNDQQKTKPLIESAGKHESRYHEWLESIFSRLMNDFGHSQVYDWAIIASSAWNCRFTSRRVRGDGSVFCGILVLSIHTFDGELKQLIRTLCFRSLFYFLFHFLRYAFVGMLICTLCLFACYWMVRFFVVDVGVRMQWFRPKTHVSRRAILCLYEWMSILVATPSLLGDGGEEGGKRAMGLLGSELISKYSFRQLVRVNNHHVHVRKTRNRSSINGKC